MLLNRRTDKCFVVFLYHNPAEEEWKNNFITGSYTKKDYFNLKIYNNCNKNEQEWQLQSMYN